MTTSSASVTIQSSGRRSFKISEFREKIGVVARPNLFFAKLYGNTDINTIFSQHLPNFEFRCESTSIPGRSIATIDDIGSGPSLKLPYDITYNDIDLNIICSQDMQERVAFEKWINFIVNPNGSLSFYDVYAKGIKLQISQLDEDGDPLITYTMYDVYPISISPMNLSWEETNTYQRFSVTLNYRRYTLSKPGAQAEEAEE